MCGVGLMVVGVFERVVAGEWLDVGGGLEVGERLGADERLRIGGRLSVD